MGLSVRAYARHRRVNDKTVREAVKAGRLTGAVNADGTIDADAADRLWARNTTRERRNGTPQASPTLAAARYRKLRAAVDKYAIEVAAMRARLVTPVDAAAIVAGVLEPVVALLRRIATDAAPVAAGMAAAEAERALHAAVVSAMEDIAGGDDQQSNPPVKRSQKKARQPQLTATELEARKADLMAERIELQNALARGELVEIAAVVEGLDGWLAATRSHLLALPGRCAGKCARADAAAVEGMLTAEIVGIVAEFMP